MIPMKSRTAILALALLLGLAVLPAQGALVAQMNLGEMTQNAATIARVTVLDVEQTSMSLGGGELPVTVYTLAVDDPIKGEFDTSKGKAVIEVRMLGTVKNQPTVNGMQRLSVLPELPRLQTGHDYLLFATAPSAIGLSSPVGLGQGAFGIFVDGKVEMAANELNNAGLFAGPVSYDELADAVRAELGQ
jgi:hypothetical protein